MKKIFKYYKPITHFLPKTVLFIIPCIFLTGILFLQTSYSKESILQVHFIDVGYGDSIFMELPDNSCILIDAGYKEQGEKIVKYLKSLKVKELKDVIITHPHKNHFEGLFSILDYFKIRRVFINGDRRVEEGYFELLDKITKKNIPIRKLKEGSVIDDLPFDIEMKILNPISLNNNANNNSLVVSLKYKNVSFVFMSDVYPEVQDILLGEYSYLKESNCIKVPHHGGPISRNFIEYFKNKIFIVSTDYESLQEEEKRDLNKLNGKVYMTYDKGIIVLTSDGEKIIDENFIK